LIEKKRPGGISPENARNRASRASDFEAGFSARAKAGLDVRLARYAAAQSQ
jgi:hypothetical protein